MRLQDSYLFIFLGYQEEYDCPAGLCPRKWTSVQSSSCSSGQDGTQSTVKVQTVFSIGFYKQKQRGRQNFWKWNMGMGFPMQEVLGQQEKLCGQNQEVETHM